MRNSPSTWLRGWAAAAAGAASLFAAPLALADSISPTSFSADLGVGESVTITKTVTISAGGPTSAVLDVMFVFDITGSMSGIINGAKAAANNILTGLSGFGSLQSGVGYYADPQAGIVSNLSAANAPTVTAINGLDACTLNGVFNGALCGGDYPESGFAGLSAAANGATWRPSSNRYIIAFGDAPYNTGGGATLASTQAALAAKGITLIGLSYSTDNFNQITALGGTAYNSSTSPTQIVNDILAGVSSSFATYSSVTVDDLDSGLPEIAVSVVCTGADSGSCVGDKAMGSYDRSVDRTFTFETTFTRMAAGDKTFDTYALVDGKIVAAERDTFGGGAAPEPATLSLVGLSLFGLGALRRRRAH